MNTIHPTAVVDPGAIIGTGNYIGPFCYIGPKVRLGDMNHLEAYVALGTAGQYRDKESRGMVVIGRGNVFREHSQVHCAMDGVTRIENDGYFMANAHIAHDCCIENRVTMCNNATLGGETYIMKGATLGFGAIVHQGQVVGSCAMLGMGAIVPKSVDIEPGNIYAGNPARLIGPNEVGLKRYPIELGYEIERYDRLRRP